MCHWSLCPLSQMYGRRRVALITVGLALVVLAFSSALELSWKDVCLPKNAAPADGSNDTTATYVITGLYSKGGIYEGFDSRHYLQMAAVVMGSATFLVCVTLWSELWDEHLLRHRLLICTSMTIFTGCMLIGELAMFAARCQGAVTYPRGFWLDLMAVVLFFIPVAPFLEELVYLCRAARRTYITIP